MQGVVKAYDPVTGDGIIMCDTDLADYPTAAREYLQFVSEFVGVPIALVGTGPGREQVIWMSGANASVLTAPGASPVRRHSVTTDSAVCSAATRWIARVTIRRARSWAGPTPTCSKCGSTAA